MADDPASHGASASAASQVQHVPLNVVADGLAAHSASARTVPQAVQYVSPSAMADSSSAAHGCMRHSRMAEAQPPQPSEVPHGCMADGCIAEAQPLQPGEVPHSCMADGCTWHP
ncbi:hypothetical protein CYMTET_3948 [Cymbomonas tetramitiformis]|uniref:Uncharacterized protein n=1 Tax=Cymbomonas tetramitiformis TaxID=36881 RepID=A0AAE0H2B6_9CHLO|nr:hypothetical protein CYMTET_3948 [Cymbomonas tetramitiformis]